MVYNITHETYKFIERKNDDFYTLELITEPYLGTKYQYGNVRMRVETDENGEEYGKLSFTWQLIEGDEALTESADFQNYIGDILNFIIQDAFDTGEYNIGEKSNESTVDSNDDSEESAE